ncbi:MAG: hypothetical protein KAW84_04710 [Thermoplasmata archaeon]|nr:hypothetical protein [Thermoplasmata archaeon]
MESWKLHAVVFWGVFLTISFIALGAGLTSSSGMLEEETSYLFYGCALIILTVALCFMLIYGSMCMGRIESRILSEDADVPAKHLEKRASSMWKRLLSPALHLVFLITISSAAIPSSGWFLSTHHDINTIAALEVLLGSIVSIIFAFVVLHSIRRDIRFPKE